MGDTTARWWGRFRRALDRRGIELFANNNDGDRSITVSSGDGKRSLRVTVAPPGWDARIALTLDGADRDVAFTVALGPALYVTARTPLLVTLIEALGLGYHKAEVRLAVHDGAVWWSLWQDPDSWSSGTPWWRYGCFHVDHAVLGEPFYACEALGAVVDVEIPLPEATYRGTVQLERATWTRARWFATTRLRAKITVLDAEGKPSGIPTPGKGESAHDCDEDATYSMTCEARTTGDAVGQLVGSVLDRRAKYGGKGWRPEAKAPRWPVVAPAAMSTNAAHVFDLASVPDAELHRAVSTKTPVAREAFPGERLIPPATLATLRADPAWTAPADAGTALPRWSPILEPSSVEADVAQLRDRATLSHPVASAELLAIARRVESRGRGPAWEEAARGMMRRLLDQIGAVADLDPLSTDAERLLCDALIAPHGFPSRMGGILGNLKPGEGRWVERTSDTGWGMSSTVQAEPRTSLHNPPTAGLIHDVGGWPVEAARSRARELVARLGHGSMDWRWWLIDRCAVDTDEGFLAFVAHVTGSTDVAYRETRALRGIAASALEGAAS